MSGRIAFREVKGTRTGGKKSAVSGSKRTGQQTEEHVAKGHDMHHAVSDTTGTSDELSQEEQALRAFDLTSKYGPCIGLTRLERWERAKKFGLDPPQHVWELLQRPGAHNLSVWANRV